MLDLSILIPLAPIRHIPNEILMEIMKNCVPEGNSETSFIKARSTALTLAGVCSHWRIVAISTPQLWTKIHWKQCRIGYNYRTMMQLMLSRAGHCDLQLHIDLLTNAESELLVDAIQPHHDRFYYVCDQFNQITGAIVDGPSFARLAVLDFGEHMSTFDIIRVLKHCPALEEATIRQASFWGHSNPREGITMAQLRRLSLFFFFRTDEFLDVITTPNLKEFVVHNRGGYRWPHKGFLHFLARSKASLNVLDLKNIDMKNHEELELIDAVPHLSELHVYTDVFYLVGLYEYLEFRDGHSIILAHLKTLVISGQGVLMDLVSLHRMIESRALKYPLKQIFLEFKNAEKNIIHVTGRESTVLWEDAARLGYTVTCSDIDGRVIIPSLGKEHGV